MVARVIFRFSVSARQEELPKFAGGHKIENQKNYWNKFIIDWDKSVYNSDPCGLNFVEKIATRFRRPLQVRHAFALECLSKIISEKLVIELGCGTGRLALDLFDAGARRVIGIDISDFAIEEAKKRFTDANVPPSQYEFLSRDIGSFNLGEFGYDVIVGLGVLQYLSEDELKSILSKCKEDTMFFFEFHQSGFTLSNILHFTYRFLKKLPGVNFPPYKTLSKFYLGRMFGEYGFGMRYFNYMGIDFISNIEDIAKDWQRL